MLGVASKSNARGALGVVMNWFLLWVGRGGVTGVVVPGLTRVAVHSARCRTVGAGRSCGIAHDG